MAEKKITEIGGLYLDPSELAVALWVDKKMQIQTQPGQLWVETNSHKGI